MLNKINNYRIQMSYLTQGKNLDPTYYVQALDIPTYTVIKYRVIPVCQV